MHNETTAERVKSLLATGEYLSAAGLVQALSKEQPSLSSRHVLRTLAEILHTDSPTQPQALRDHAGAPLNEAVATELWVTLRRDRSTRTVVAEIAQLDDRTFFVLSGMRGERWWTVLPKPTEDATNAALTWLRNHIGKDLHVIPHLATHPLLSAATPPPGVTIADYAHPPLPYTPRSPVASPSADQHPHLDALEAESIRIIRETVAVGKKPGMLFSLGKDSMVMLTLARKAFWPEPVPFPLLLIDSLWNFQEMYRFQDYLESQPDIELLSYTNPEVVEKSINPFEHGSAVHTDVSLTQAVRQGLDLHGFDFVFGGGRRDEERSRAKERVFSIRSHKHGWDPKNQRPELWNLYNTALADKESMRVFPLSNWTELDIWRYIERENIDVVPLYFSKIRPFVERNGSLILVDDGRFRREPGERVFFEPIRFRTLGCYPLTGGVRSEAKTVSDIIQELEATRVSERSSRIIDFDQGASMEQKKKEGYF